MNDDKTNPTGNAGSVSQPEVLPTVDTSDSNFIAEIETMDLSPLKDKTFLVAVSTGDRNKGRFLCNTVKGPYDFLSMVQAVYDMHKNHWHHAKAIILDTDADARVKYLDAGTIDYIEAKAPDIIFDETLGKEILGDFTCRAGIIEHEQESIPEKAEEHK